jgi:hypothetical protein
LCAFLERNDLGEFFQPLLDAGLHSLEKVCTISLDKTSLRDSLQMTKVTQVLLLAFATFFEYPTVLKLLLVWAFLLTPLVI